jgi:hypothetical protein
MPIKKFTTTLLIALLLLLHLTGCTAVAPVSTVKIANGIDMQLLLPTKKLSETQKITARYRQDQHTLIMQVQASPQQVVMAGLTPTGTRLFSLSFDGKTVESWQSPLFTAPFDGSYILADFELATLDLTTLRSALPSDCTLTDSTQGKTRERMLRNQQGVTVIRIEYEDKKTRYCHLERDYCLQIETLQ